MWLPVVKVPAVLPWQLLQVIAAPPQLTVR